jgi:hypothetical protein
MSAKHPAFSSVAAAGQRYLHATCSRLSSRKFNLHPSAQMLLIHPAISGDEHMIGRDLDFDLHNAIQHLIAEGLLEENSDPHRAARIVIHDGYESLTPVQRMLYDAVVAPALEKTMRGN